MTANDTANLNWLLAMLLFLVGMLTLFTVMSSNALYRLAAWSQARARRLDEERAATHAIREEALLFQRQLESQLLDHRHKPEIVKTIVEIAER